MRYRGRAASAASPRAVDDPAVTPGATRMWDRSVEGPAVAPCRSTDAPPTTMSLGGAGPLSAPAARASSTRFRSRVWAISPAPTPGVDRRALTIASSPVTTMAATGPPAGPLPRPSASWRTASSRAAPRDGTIVTPTLPNWPATTGPDGARRSSKGAGSAAVIAVASCSAGRLSSAHRGPKSTTEAPAASHELRKPSSAAGP